MNNYIFDIGGRGDALMQDIIDQARTSPSHGALPPVLAGNAAVTRFPSGEYAVSYMHSVRGDRVFLLCSTRTADDVLKLQMAVDAAKRNSAAEIIAVVPYMSYGRADRKDARPGHQRSSIGASVVAVTLEALGLDRIITVDLHAEQIQGMFRIPVDHAECSELLARFIVAQHKEGDRVVLLSPDAGGVKRVTKVVGHMNRLLPGLRTSIAFTSKERAADNSIARMTLYGDVDDMEVYLVDDMIDTGGTTVESAATAIGAGARSVVAVCTHLLLTGPAADRIGESCIEDVVSTNTLEMTLQQQHDAAWAPETRFRTTTLSVAGVIAEYVRASINSTV